jgi:putative ABC transport system permease protein
MSNLNNKKNQIRKVDLFILAIGSLGSNKLRTILTILGVSIGVFSVIGVMTGLTAVKTNINEGLNFLEASVFQIKREPSMQFFGKKSNWRKRPKINPQQADQFKEAMEEEGIPVTLIANDGGERIQYKNKKTSPRVTVIGTNENYLITNKFELEYGRNLTKGDLAFNRPVVVIGKEIEQELFPIENPMGKRVLVEDDWYEVIGILKEKGERFGSSMDNIVMIPLTKFVEIHWNPWRSMQISVQAPSTIEMVATKDLAVGKMRLARGLEPEEKNDFEISSNDSAQEAFNKIAFVVSIGGLLISSIALLCSGIGIMNIMLVSVTERTREIGIRKSLGARKKDILYQFLIESVFLSEMGALLGIILGLAAGNIFAFQMNVSVMIPWGWVFTAVFSCSVIGIGFGLYPAWHAANLKPVDALRYE